MDLGSPTTIVALAALALAVIDLGLAAWYLVWMRRVRRAQRALLAGENVDLVEFAVGMQARQEQVERVVADAQAALATAQGRIDGCLSRQAVVRYDAYADAGGRQSTTIAMLDEHGTGLVLSAIQDRAYARVYVKDVDAGKAAGIALSPEEQQAVEQALAGG
jgi:hypothetical protein